MQNEDLKIRAFMSPYGGRRIKFFAHRTGLDAAQIKMVPCEEGADLPVFFSLPTDFSNAAQVLMDDLWACGIRPTEGQGSAGAMRAMESHLADMRRLVFDLVTLPKPKEL